MLVVVIALAAIVIALAVMTSAKKVIRKMSDAETRLAAAVAANTEVATRVVQELQSIPQRIRDAIADDDVKEEGALGDLATEIESTNQELAAALAPAPNQEPTPEA